MPVSGEERAISNPAEFHRFLQAVFDMLKPEADKIEVETTLQEVDKSFTLSEAIDFLNATDDRKFSWIRLLFQEPEVEQSEEAVIEEFKGLIDTAKNLGVSEQRLQRVLEQAGISLVRPRVTSAGLKAARKRVEELTRGLEAERERAKQVAEATKPLPPPPDIVDITKLAPDIIDSFFGMLPNRAKLIEGSAYLPKDLYYISPSTSQVLIRANDQFINIGTSALISRIEKTLLDVEGMGLAAERPLTPEQINILASDFATVIRANFGRDPFPSELEQLDKLLEDLRAAALPFTPASERVRALAETIVRGQFERRGIARPLATPMGPVRAMFE